MRRFNNLSKVIVLSICLSLLVISACIKNSTDSSESILDVIIGVIADIHYLDPELGTSGAAFDAYLLQDRKMIAESAALLDAVLDELIAAGIEILLVPGDLTKDGEKASHENVAAYFAGMEDAGIDVYVVPGNHDVANPHAMSFVGDAVVPVESVTPAEFSTIYGDYGYGEALEQDPNSLSYLAEIAEGLWLLAIDVCRYAENTDHPVTGGRFAPATWTWIQEKLQEAEDQGKLVLGMMHHGIMEHFLGQTQFFADYVVEDYIAKSTALADMGLKVMFTGHFHSQDIVKLSRANGFLFDIETGSTVTYPCPYRIIELHDRTMSISSHMITDIAYDTGGQTLSDYASTYLQQGLAGIIAFMLINDYGMPEADAVVAAPLMVEAIMAHYVGDESPTAQTQAIIAQLIADPNPLNQLLGNALNFIWLDLQPADNDIVIDLETGIASEVVH